MRGDWEEGQRVRLRTMYEGTNGKEGWIVELREHDCDVKIGNFTFLTFEDQIEKVEGAQ